MKKDDWDVTDADPRSGGERKPWSTPVLSVVAAELAENAPDGVIDGYGLS